MLKIAFHQNFVLPLPAGHRFPMEKYELLPQQLLHEGTCTSENFFEPDLPNEEDILAVHNDEYVSALRTLALDRKAMRRIGFPLSRELVERELRIVCGTIQAAGFAVKNGIGMNIAGGTHHAYSFRGEGFCLLNDQAVAAAYLLKEKLARKILIIDLDVHQGNGTAEIFSKEDNVFTFSMHCRNNYPFKKEKSDLDLELEDGTADEEYLTILRQHLNSLMEQQKPDFVFYQSGVDILITDKLGKLSCTEAGCKERDRLVLQTCKDHKVPVEVSMGGGYSPNIRDIVDAHANTFRLAQDIFF